MNVSELLDNIDEVLDAAWNLPLSGGKTVVDAEVIRELIDKIRINLPQEIRKAKAIVADRKSIMEDAKQEADQIINTATERAKKLVERDEIVKRSKEKGNAILMEAHTKSRDIKKAASEYVDELSSKAEKEFSEVLLAIKKARKNMKLFQNSLKK